MAQIKIKKILWLFLELIVLNGAIIWAGKGMYFLTNVVCIWFLLFMNAWIINDRFKLDVTEKDNKKDKNSHRLIMLSFYIGVLITIYHSAHYESEIPASWFMVGIGSIIVGFGLYLRILSIRILGNYFTARIQISEGQAIIKEGIYKYLRHPSYMAIMLVFLGVPTIFSSIYGLIWIILVVFPFIFYRVKIEEEMLIEAFGEEYVNYMKETKRLIPSVF